MYLIIFVSFLVACLAQDASYYCSQIYVQGLGSTSAGYFAMKVQGGFAKYQFKVNMDTLGALCDPSLAGMQYHIHTNMSNSGTPEFNCGSTDNHYDPGYACGAKSQYQVYPTGNSYCALLGRTTGYTCSADHPNIDVYNAQEGSCEKGDLSGKFGTIYPDDDNYIQSSGVLTDYWPVNADDYMVNHLPYTLRWSSLVIHCGQNANKVMCGDFLMSSSGDMANCPSMTGDSWDSPFSSDTDCDDDHDHILSNNASITVIVFMIVFLCIASYQAMGTYSKRNDANGVSVK